MNSSHFVETYLEQQEQLFRSLSQEKIIALIAIFERAWREDRQIFVCGNGGSAANASHFITDLSKSASDALGKPFRGLSLNDNVSWMTALGNDYAYEDVFVRQLMNFAQAGDLLMVLSVSGNSPNLVKALKWAKEKGVYCIALVGGKPCQLADLADFVIAVADTHYGRVEDAQMGICHMVCYAFIEQGKS
jgi:D-sedoheptulose 7-phosphate isomerase